MNKKYALLIGTINKISLKYAKTLINKDFNIILVTKESNHNINQLRIANPNREIITLVYNLSQITETYKMCEEISGFNIEITIFNNNQYIPDQFIDSKIDNIIKLIDNNIKSTQVIMKFLALKYSNNNKGIFLNICSIGSILPMPNMPISFSSASFTYNLFATVNLEFKKLKNKIRCINVMLPVLVTTNENIVYDDEKLNEFTTDTIEKIYKNKRKSLLCYGSKTRFLFFISHILPKSFIGKIAAKEIRH